MVSFSFIRFGCCLHHKTSCHNNTTTSRGTSCTVGVVGVGVVGVGVVSVGGCGCGGCGCGYYFIYLGCGTFLNGSCL